MPWVVRLYMETIHKLQRLGYLTYRWTNFYTTYICVDLAHHKIFHAKVGKGEIDHAHHKIFHAKVGKGDIIEELV